MKIRYYSVRAGNGYWQPTAKMRRLGFSPIACGPDGPAAWNIAEEANRRWQAARAGVAAEAVGEAEADTLADRIGYIYFLFSGSKVKIGFSRKPFARMGDLMTGLSAPPRLILMFRGRPRDEKALHARYQAHHANGEWFRVNAQMQRDVLRFSAFDRLADALSNGTDREQSLNGFKLSGPASNNGENVDFASH